LPYTERWHIPATVREMYMAGWDKTVLQCGVELILKVSDEIIYKTTHKTVDKIKSI
jgi:hypothetical protein